MGHVSRLTLLSGAATLLALTLSACAGSAEEAPPISSPTPSIAEIQEAFLPQSSPPAQTYVLQPGDSLYAVALKFGVSVGELMEVNHIADFRLLSPGQELKIPGPRDLYPRSP